MSDLRLPPSSPFAPLDMSRGDSVGSHGSPNLSSHPVDHGSQGGAWLISRRLGGPTTLGGAGGRGETKTRKQAWGPGGPGMRGPHGCSRPLQATVAVATVATATTAAAAAAAP